MAKTKKEFIIFISSPSDVDDERKTIEDVVEEINRGALANRLDIFCKTWRWEVDCIPTISDSPQVEINNQTPEYDIFIGILWKRFGTKTKKARSGTEEEFRRAFEKFKFEKSQFPWIMIYFSQRPILIEETESEENIEQFRSLNRFKKELKKQGIVAYYKDLDDFKSKVKAHIEHVLNKLEIQREKEIGPDIKELVYKKFATRFEEAADWYISKYEEKKIRHEYIELGSLDHKDDDEGTLSLAVDKEIELGRHIAILGDFGSGKTEFARHYAYKKVKEWKKNPSNSRYVLLFELRNYEKRTSIYDWIIDRVEEKTGVVMEKTEFVRQLNNNKLLLIFDGFDEMTKPSDGIRISDNLKAIIGICGAGSPIIITCRTTFFDAEVEEENLKDFKRLYIAKMNGQQISDYTRNTIPKEREKFRTLIKERCSHLLDLAGRPLFLKMMVEAYENGKLKDIKNQADLYITITNKWIINESNRQVAILEPAIRQDFVRELAFWMFTHSKYALNSRELISIMPGILKKVNKESSKNFDEKSISMDITNCSFLDRQDNDNSGKSSFAFAHHSFLEFFVAEKLADELMKGVTENFADRVLYEEIFEFLAQILKIDDKYTALTKTLVNLKSPLIARINSIPPLRKQLNENAIQYLLKAFIEDEHPAVRYVCGYTLATFQLTYPSFFEEKTISISLENAHDKEKNSLVRLRMALLLTKGEYVKYKELNSDYEFYIDSLEDIISVKKIVDAFEKVLKVNREHVIVIEESIRLLSIYIFLKGKDQKYYATLRNYIFNLAYKHKAEKIRRIALWAIDKIGLIDSNEPEDRAKAIDIIKVGKKDSRASVKAMATSIMDKYPHIFFK